MTWDGVLLSVGAGANQVLYDLSLDNPGSPPADLFSINKQGGYVVGDGVFATGVPEPATWAMMLAGVGMIAAGLRMARRKVATALTAA